MSTAHSITATLAGLGLALSLSACSSEDTAEPSAQYSTSSAAAQAGVAKLKTLVGGGEATIDDVKAQVESIGTATTTAAEDATDLADWSRPTSRPPTRRSTTPSRPSPATPP